MQVRLGLQIERQPDETTCGPTCLHAVYRYYGLNIQLAELIGQIPSLAGGGTLAVNLGVDALRRGFEATIYTYNVQLFDPTWFYAPSAQIAARLRAQLQAKPGIKLAAATAAYLDFLSLGGRIKFEDLTPALMRRYLKKETPILTGLSATYLYRTPREVGPKMDYNDIYGEPTGHFVVLCGYDQEERNVLLADPLRSNPVSPKDLQYEVNIDRLICSILLGILTYDDNLLIIRPRPTR